MPETQRILYTWCRWRCSERARYGGSYFEIKEAASNHWNTKVTLHHLWHKASGDFFVCIATLGLWKLPYKWNVLLLLLWQSSKFYKCLNCYFNCSKMPLFNSTLGKVEVDFSYCSVQLQPHRKDSTGEVNHAWWWLLAGVLSNAERHDETLGW